MYVVKIQFVVEDSTVSFSAPQPVVGGEKVSLMRMEKYTNPWVKQYVIKSQFNMCPFSGLEVAGSPLRSMT